MASSTTINSNSYCVTLTKLKNRIQRIWPTFTRFLLHHDNTRPHCRAQTNEKIERLNFEFIPHPSYSSDLTPADFYLFPKLKEEFKGSHFNSNHKEASFFADEFQKWILRLQQCVDCNGNYVEKQCIILFGILFSTF